MAVTLASAELRQAMYDLEQFCTITTANATATTTAAAAAATVYDLEQNCTTDEPQTVVKKKSKLHCASACSGQLECREYNFDDTTEDCSLYKHKALFFEAQPNCSRYKVRCSHRR